MEVTVNSEQKILKAGEMSVALSYNPHAYRTPESSRSSVLIIPSYLCEEFILAVKDKQVVNPFVSNKEAVRKIKQCIAELVADEINDIKLIGYVYVILGIVMDNITFCETDTSLDPGLSSRLLFYINENYKSDLTLESIAMHFGMNPSYLSRYFKSSFHIGINQYLTIIRLKNTLMLMHENKHNITYCALESGFNSMRTFYRVFYNEFQCTPKEYLSRNSMSQKDLHHQINKNAN